MLWVYATLRRGGFKGSKQIVQHNLLTFMAASFNWQCMIWQWKSFHGCWPLNFPRWAMTLLAKALPNGRFSCQNGRRLLFPQDDAENLSGSIMSFGTWHSFEEQRTRSHCNQLPFLTLIHLQKVDRLFYLKLLCCWLLRITFLRICFHWK